MQVIKDYLFIENIESLKSKLQRSVSDVYQALSDFSKIVSLQDSSTQLQSIVFLLTAAEEGVLTREATVFSSDQAVLKTLNFIYNFELERETQQDTKKLAGFIQTGLNEEQLQLHISRINSAKNQCKKIITSIKDKDISKQADLRFEFVHHTCGFSHFVTNELYRNLVCLTEPIDSIYFGLEKHNKQSKILFPKVKATLCNDDEDTKVVVRKRHNSLPIFLASNSTLLALNKHGKKEAIRHRYSI